MQFGNVYATGATDPLGIVERARNDGLDQDGLEHDFDTMIGTGLSGALVIPALAQAFGKEWAILRKIGEFSHSSHTIEGNIGERWLFVDDLVSSGLTFRRVRDGVRQACVDWGHTTTFAGAWLYRNPSAYYSAEKADKRFNYDSVTEREERAERRQRAEYELARA